MSDPWHSAEFDGTAEGWVQLPAPTYPSLTHGLTITEYSKAYNHSSHLSDDVGVFRSDCEGCRKHLSEAFGPTVAKVIDIHGRNGLDLTDEQKADEGFLSTQAGNAVEWGHFHEAIELLIAALEVTGD